MRPSTMLITTIAATALLVPVALAPAADQTHKKYNNCTALNKDYAHGVGKRGATDKVSGSSKPVTNFTRNNAVYKENTARDRDKDGIACEKR